MRLSRFPRSILALGFLMLACAPAWSGNIKPHAAQVAGGAQQ
jgi:hypothetical protein